MAEAKSTPLEPGMLLLDKSNPRPVIYTAISKRTVVASYDGVNERAQLSKSGVPKGWLVLNNRALARYIVDNEAEIRREDAARRAAPKCEKATNA